MDPESRRKTGRALTILGATTIALCIFAALSTLDSDAVFMMTVLATGAGFVGICGVYMLVTNPPRQVSPHRPAVQLPPRRRQNHMPAPQSVASQPMQGLAGAEAALADLLGQLPDADPVWIAEGLDAYQGPGPVSWIFVRSLALASGASGVP